MLTTQHKRLLQIGGSVNFLIQFPANHKCLTTTSLPASGVADSSDYFNTVLYSADGNPVSITTGHASDCVWIKMRNSGNNHFLYDIVRGVGQRLMTSSTATEDNASDSLTAFNSDGFSLGADTSTGGVNASGTNLVAWSWDAGSSTVSNTDGSITTQVRASQTAGFSIATYSYNNSLGSQTLGHGLGEAYSRSRHPKRSQSWRELSVYSSVIGFSNRAHLNTHANYSGTTTFGSASATSTVNRANNMNNGNYVDYSFVSIPGFSLFSTYEGNGSLDRYPSFTVDSGPH